MESKFDLVDTMDKKIANRLYEVGASTRLLLRDFNQDLTKEVYSGIMDYFYLNVIDKILSEGPPTNFLNKENIISMVFEMLMSSDELKTPVQVDSNIFMGSSTDGKTSVSKRFNFIVFSLFVDIPVIAVSVDQDDKFAVLFAKFHALCEEVKDGDKLQKKFLAANSLEETDFLNESIMFAPIIEMIRSEDTSRLKPRQINTYLELKSKGYLPFVKKMTKSPRELSSPLTYKNSNKRSLQNSSNDFDYEEGDSNDFPDSFGRKQQDFDDDFLPSSSSNARKRGRHTPAVPKPKTEKKPNFLRPRGKLSAFDSLWWDHFECLVTFHEKHNHYNIPINQTVRKVSPGYDDQILKLGDWLSKEKPKMENYIVCDYNKYELLAECMTNGLWTSDEVSVAGQPNTPTTVTVNATSSSANPEPALEKSSSLAQPFSEPKFQKQAIPKRNLNQPSPRGMVTIEDSNSLPGFPRSTPIGPFAQRKSGNSTPKSKTSDDASLLNLEPIPATAEPKETKNNHNFFKRSEKFAETKAVLPMSTTPPKLVVSDLLAADAKSSKSPDSLPNDDDDEVELVLNKKRTALSTSSNHSYVLYQKPADDNNGNNNPSLALGHVTGGDPTTFVEVKQMVPSDPEDLINSKYHETDSPATALPVKSVFQAVTLTIGKKKSFSSGCHFLFLNFSFFTILDKGLTAETITKIRLTTAKFGMKFE
jgi:hypothetical protein